MKNIVIKLDHEFNIETQEYEFLFTRDLENRDKPWNAYSFKIPAAVWQKDPRVLVNYVNKGLDILLE